MELVQTPAETLPDGASGEVKVRRPTLEYEQCSADIYEVKLLALYALSSEDASIECTLQKVNLEDKPQYYALAYVWRKPLKNLTSLSMGAWYLLGLIILALSHMRGV